MYIDLYMRLFPSISDHSLYSCRCVYRRACDRGLTGLLSSMYMYIYIHTERERETGQ